MKPAYLLVMILVLASFSWAIEIIEPKIAKDITDDSVLDIGTIGPGQTISVAIHPKVYDGGKFGTGGRYDFATVEGLPFGWKGKNSKIYGDPLQVEITADKNAAEGEYSAKITAHDENNGEMLGTVAFTVKVKIVHDVLDTSVSPSSITVGPGQPARFAITVTNKGTASDVFIVSATGVERWIFEKPVYVPAMSSRTVVYEITENEEERYFPDIKIVSASSEIIQEDHKVVFSVQPNLLSDFKAANHGIFIFPIFEAPIYALAGLISNLW